MTFPAHRSRRVVVTGMGLVCPLGASLDEVWSALVAGQSGVGLISRFDTTLFPVKIAAEVKNFTTAGKISPKEVRKMGLFIQYGVIAGLSALEDAGLTGLFGEEGAAKSIDPVRVGVSLASGMGGLPEIQYWDRELASKEKKNTSPFFVPMIIPNLASGHMSIASNAKGPNLCFSTACASSAHAVGEAGKTIASGVADIMIAGGCEAVICELGIAGFASMKALSTRNSEPIKASRPFDQARDGFVMGEGGAVLILEEYEHAKKRGAKIYAELRGYAATADAHHITTPAPEGEGAKACMEIALKDAGLNSSAIGYVNCHGTSTPTGDAHEAQATAKVFGEHRTKIHVSSTKSMTGHLLGAAGSLEAIFSVLALRNGVVPPTANLDNLDEDCRATGLNFTANRSVEKKLDAVLSNSFGFGGTNGTLIFSRI